MIAALRHWWFFRSTIHRLDEWRLHGVKLGVRDMSLPMKAVLVKGAYEAAEVAACSKVIRPGDRVLELGGAIGYIGLHCLINCKAAAVVSVEANPDTASRLRQNYIRNGLTASVIEAAVAEQEGPIEFNVGSDFWADGIATSGEGRRNIQVPGRTFEKLWNQTSPHPNVLISDIEGAETILPWSALPDAIERIIIELHPRAYGTAKTFHLLKTMMDAGFSVVFSAADVFALERDRNVG